MTASTLRNKDLPLVKVKNFNGFSYSNYVNDLNRASAANS